MSAKRIADLIYQPFMVQLKGYYACQQRSGGRILGSEDELNKLAHLCGLGERAETFTKTFGSSWVDKTDVRTSNHPNGQAKGGNKKRGGV